MTKRSWLLERHSKGQFYKTRCWVRESASCFVFCNSNVFSYFTVFGRCHISYRPKCPYKGWKWTKPHLISNIYQRNPLHNEQLAFRNSPLRNIIGYGRIKMLFEQSWNVFSAVEEMLRNLWYRWYLWKIMIYIKMERLSLVINIF